MKCIPVTFIVLGFILIHCRDAPAQEPTTKLPEDGWWVRYHAVKKETGIDGQVQELTGKLTFSLVGTVVEEGETYRWIEVNSVFAAREKENIVIRKYLVPEKDLLEREHSLEARKRGWIKVDKRDVRAVKVGQDTNSLETRLRFLPRMWQAADRVDAERVVDYQQGRLTIPQARVLNVTTSGNITRRRNGVDEKRKHLTESTAWFDQKTAPVFAAAKTQTKIYLNDELESTNEEELTIEDVGTDAKSQLPANN